MESLTFDQLPQAVSKLQDKLNDIEKLLLENHSQPAEHDELLNIKDTAKFLNLSVPTIYSKVCRKEIPVNKQGKRLYFYKSELVNWIKSGRKKTAAEIRQEAESMLLSNRKKENRS
ncbi:AlpA family transcriptional regulator [Mucilaginibacter gracilis]|uniref:AlpA family transcriptional regulator n=1 Tax=Mucilaginibacter gracilis TaxID=423350 RepID=A0A495J5Y4_9SPHI|nr:helix-turn-helix domain-containing protein [Mucilaginibacter gracilis]RKR84406.1 AlpA family transcriptional regulator [Mucilaginibacter gracilis]